MRRILPLVLAVLVVALLTSCAPGAAPDRATRVSDTSVDTSSDAAAKARPTALFFGDSYFVGGGCAPDAMRSMAFFASRQLGYRPVIRGAGGTGFASANVEYGIPAYLPQIAAGALDTADPRLVVIEGGTNDYGQPQRKIRRNAKKVLQIARAKYPSAVLVLAGPMQTYGDFSVSDPIKTTLKTLARSMGVPFVNMQRWTLGHDDWLCSDYVHPTYAGAEIIGQRLAAALDKRGA